MREYVDRIQRFEDSYDEIVAGLGPAMRSGIDRELERRGLTASNEDETGPDQTDATAASEVQSEVIGGIKDQVQTYVAAVAAGRSEAVQNLYTRLLENFDDDAERAVLIKALFSDTYQRLRTADYGPSEAEQDVWQQALNSTAVAARHENGWLYRGVFPELGEATVSRGSFNVTVTPELINALDAYIAAGKVRANYKFGAPETGASTQERHDAISIYFLEEPTDEVLADLAEIVSPYVRGDELLGEKVGDGFFMSEVGSVQDEHIADLVALADTADPALAAAIKQYALNRQGRMAMSEAQFYAVKKVAAVFGYELSYSTDTGFDLALI